VFNRVGDTEPCSSNVRVIAATNQDLIAAVRENRFREDLFYRLAAVVVKLPALRQRNEDIPLLAASLLEKINGEFARDEPDYKHKSLSAEAVSYLKQLSWPGNVRQLHNVLVQAAVMAEEDALQEADIHQALTDVESPSDHGLLDWQLGEDFDLQSLLRRMRRHYFKRAMTEGRGNRTEAARLLGYESPQKFTAQLNSLGEGDFG